MEDYSVSFTLEHRMSLTSTDAYSDIVQDYECRIVHEVDDHESTAGTFDFYVVNLSLAINRGLDIVDVADSLNQDLYNYCETVFEPGTATEMRDAVVDQFRDVAGSRLLILHLARIRPDHRGKRLALATAHKVIEQFGDGLVIAKPQPLQHQPGYADERAMRYDTFEPVPAIAMKRLVSHWRRLGFAPIGKTGYLGLTTAREIPTPKLLASGRTKSTPKRSRALGRR